MNKINNKGGQRLNNHGHNFLQDNKNAIKSNSVKLMDKTNGLNKKNYKRR